MNQAFGSTPETIRNLFGNVPVLKNTQGPTPVTALTAVSDHLIGINKIMAEGGVLPESFVFAQAKLYEAKLAVDAAIAYGWNGGKTH